MYRIAPFRTCRRRLFCHLRTSTFCAYNAICKTSYQRASASHMVCRQHAGRTVAVSGWCADELLVLLPFWAYNFFLCAFLYTLHHLYRLSYNATVLQRSGSVAIIHCGNYRCLQPYLSQPALCCGCLWRYRCGYRNNDCMLCCILPFPRQKMV